MRDPDGRPLPPPPVPATADLRSFPYLPLTVASLRDSRLAILATGDEFRCAILLWAAAWHQVPAGSLPDDDRELAALAGFGVAVKMWRKVRKMALDGFEKHSDGRLYSAEISKKVLVALREQKKSLWRREIDRIRKANERNGTSLPVPTFEEFLAVSSAEPAQDAPPAPAARPADGAGLSNGQMPRVRRTTPENPLDLDHNRTDTEQNRKIDKKDPPLGPPLAATAEDAASGEAAARPKRTAHRIPPDWQPGPADAAFAEGLGLNARLVSAAFLDYWTGTGRPMADWSACWRTWCRREVAGRPAPASRQAAGSRVDAREASAQRRAARNSELERQLFGPQDTFDGRTIDEHGAEI